MRDSEPIPAHTEDDDEEGEQKKCANVTCGRTLQIGDDAVMLQRVVMGVQRPVPLEEPKLFHSDKCLQEYICDSETGFVPKRLP